MIQMDYETQELEKKLALNKWICNFLTNNAEVYSEYFVKHVN